MTTSVALVRSDMKHALTLYAPPSPIPEEPAVKSDHVITFWDPWHELGLYDPIRNMMPCMGRVAMLHGAPCQFEAPIEKAADLKGVLVTIASKSPEETNDNDLTRLLDLGICVNCVDNGEEAKSMGLKALHHRLNVARMHYERLDRFVDEIRKLRSYVQQLQSAPVPMASSLQTTHQDRVTDQLRSRINYLEQENAAAHLETERIEAEGIDREAKLDRDLMERDEMIEDLNQQLSDARQQYQTEQTMLTQQVNDREEQIRSLERQSQHHSTEVEQLRGQLETKKSKSWRRRLRRWFKRSDT